MGISDESQQASMWQVTDEEDLRGWGANIKTKKVVALNAELVRESIAKVVSAHYEPMLSNLGLSKNQISNQSLEELKESLERVNDVLRNPDSFGLLRIQVTSEGNALIATPNSDYNFEIGIAPLLLDRKKIILEKIRLLTANEKIENLQDLVEQIKDEDVKDQLNQELAKLSTENKQIRDLQKEVEREQAFERQKTQAELARLSIELFERRSKVWFSLLERESAATIIGGLLLVIIVTAHVAAIFTKITIPEILNNAFLLILGYFFGQSASQSSNKSL